MANGSESLFLSQKTDDDVLVDENGLTKVITYNIKDTGRVFTQVKRNYDAVGASVLLNSTTVQEGVKNGDYFGYFGHWIRELLGLDPQEGGFVDGKLVIVEPALQIKMLKADKNGDISFQVQFLDTAMGNMAKRIYSQKKGGFSIVWDYYKNSDGSLLPYQFYGFDMVLTPNFTKNRGYAMDSTMRDLLGSVAMDSTDMFSMGTLLTPLFEKLRALEADKLRLEATVDDLSTALARKQVSATAMDSTKKFNLAQIQQGESHLLRADDFLSATLVGFQKTDDDAPVQQNGVLIEHILNG